MSTTHEYTCSCCQDRHTGPALSYGAPAPDLWHPDYAKDPDSFLADDLCTIKGQAFFIHGLIEIPVSDTGDTFSWDVWASLSATSFAHAVKHWEHPQREKEPPYFGWLSTELTLYGAPTLNLKTRVHTRPVGQRPWIELEPTDHPLAVEQRHGITRARVAELSDLLLARGGRER